MRGQILITHVLLSATLILGACGPEHADTNSQQGLKSKIALNTEGSVAEGSSAPAAAEATDAAPAAGAIISDMTAAPSVQAVPDSQFLPPLNTERYAHTDDNPVKRVTEVPVSTFSIDVDTGSYANVRRFLMNG